MRVLSFENVVVRRRSAHLLDSITWTVHDDERWVIVGPNGAGKTTLVSVAAARTFPTFGRVEVLGETLGRVDISEIKPRVGLASASLLHEIPLHEKAIDVVATGAYAITGRWREVYHQQDVDRAMDLLTHWGARAYASRPMASLSEGESKRVLIARALMSNPELLLLDEPGAGLDLSGREELVSMLQAVASDSGGPTLVLVTHHLEEIPPGSTHALILSNGKTVGAGAIEQTVTSESLSAAYGIDIEVERVRGRWVAVAERSEQ